MRVWHNRMMKGAARSTEFQSNLPIWLVLGFVFWLTFLLVLQPGNVARATAAGFELSFGRETTRIVGAVIIGAASTPMVLFFASRYSLGKFRRLQELLWLLTALIALAGALNVISSFVAAWTFDHRWYPDAIAVRDQLIRNWTLLTFALVSLTVIIRIADRPGFLRTPASPPRADPATQRILVKSGRRSFYLDVDCIDWVEAQGNYIALHVGPNTHLIRETLSSFEQQFEGNQFIRVHRRILVAIGRIQSISNIENGRATLLLTTGQEIVTSQRHRRNVRKEWIALFGPSAARTNATTAMRPHESS